MRTKAILSVLLVAVFWANLSSRTIWKDRNIYSTSESLAVGDIVVVRVDDISRLQFSLTMNERKNSTVNSVPDMSITGFLPSVSANRTITGKDSSDVSSRGRFNVDVSSRITGTRDNKYLIQGSRTYVFNGTTSRITVSGLLDPLLIRGRTVNSSNIADFRLTFDSRREEGLTITRPALAEGKGAEMALTEEEKQRIIIDYLQTMLRELMR